jgi:hypothetical protein
LLPFDPQLMRPSHAPITQVKMEILVVIANKTNFLEIVDELAAYAMPPSVGH